VFDGHGDVVVAILAHSVLTVVTAGCLLRRQPDHPAAARAALRAPSRLSGGTSHRWVYRRHLGAAPRRGLRKPQIALRPLMSRRAPRGARPSAMVGPSCTADSDAIGRAAGGPHMDVMGGCLPHHLARCWAHDGSKCCALNWARPPQWSTVESGLDHADGVMKVIDLCDVCRRLGAVIAYPARVDRRYAPEATSTDLVQGTNL